MKLRLPLLLRLALLSTAAAYTLGSGCLFADDAPADAAQDDPIAEAVDEEESDSPTIGFEGYTESQLVDIQSSDSAGAVIRQMLENSTTGAVANVGTSSSTSNGATAAAESPALTLSAPAEPVTDTTLSDSAGEGAVAPFFSAEEAAALVVASPATSTPSLKNTSTATLSSSDSPDETTSSSSATGASASLGSVGSAGGAGASSGGGSASYTLTSSAPDSSSSLVITTPTDDTSSDPIAEDVLEDTPTEDTTTSTLPDSSTSTLAGTSSTSATTRTLPVLKLLGSTSETSTQGIVKVDEQTLSAGSKLKGVEFVWGQMASGPAVNILYLGNNDPSPKSVEVAADSFYVCPAGDNTMFNIETLVVSNKDSCVNVQNNPWVGYNKGAYSLDLTVKQLSVNGSASLDVSRTQTGAISVSIGKVENSSTESTTGPLLTSVTNSGTLTLGINANPTENVKASSVSIGILTNKANGTMTLNGTTTITGLITNYGKLTNNGTLTLAFGAVLNLEQFSRENVSAPSSSGKQTIQYTFTIADGSGSLSKEDGAILRFNGCDNLGNLTIRNNKIAAERTEYWIVNNETKTAADIVESSVQAIVVDSGCFLTDVGGEMTTSIEGSGTVQITGDVDYAGKSFLDYFSGTVKVGQGSSFNAGDTAFAKDIDLAGGSLNADGDESYTGAISVSADSKISSASEKTTLSGALSGGAKLTIEGEGTVLLSGDSSGFTGAISVDSGSLELDTKGKGSLASCSSVSVSQGATLIGSFSLTNGTFELNGVWDLTGVNAYGSGQLASYLGKVSSGSGALKFAAAGSNAYVLGGDVNTKGLDLAFVGSGQKQTEINGWQNTNSVLTVSSGSTLSTVDELRVESTATVKVESGGIVEVGGVLNLGHDVRDNYGHFLLDGGQLIAQGVGRTNGDDAVDSSKNTFRMSGGTLTLTKENAEISGVYTEISGGILDTSRAAWGISSSDASVGGVTVSDVKDGVGGNSGNALTLTGAKITGDISLEGTARLVLKNVTVTGNDVKLGGDGRTVQVALGNLTVEDSVTTKGNLEVATGNNLVVKGTYATSGAVSSLKLQGEATASLQNGDTVVATVKKNGTEADASITGGVTMKYDSDSGKAVIEGAGGGSSATITNSLLTVANGSTLSLQNVILAGSTKISAGTAAAAAVALLDEGSGESSGTVTAVDLTDSVIQLSKDNAAPDNETNPVDNLTKGSTLTKTGTSGGEGNMLPIQQDTAKVYTIDYTGATGVTLTGALTFDFDTFTVEGMTGSGYYLLNELLKEYDYVALRFADDVTVDPEKVAVTSKVTMGTETVTSTGYYVGDTAVVNATSSSGVVVYFDAMALPEPTTSTLSLLALAALCARRRRSRTRAHAE